MPLSEPGLDRELHDRFAQPLLGRLQQLASGSERRVLALNGPVGAGKTTLCRWLEQQARASGLRLAVVSIDDFYLPWAERRRRLAGNPFGVHRVPPGSHDTELAQRLLERWQTGAELVLPCFDKGLRQGQGDRCGERRVEADVLVLEGWLVACRSLGAAGLMALDPETLAALRPAERDWLPRWDAALTAYQPIWDHCQELWLLRPHSWSAPRRWRFQAEARQRRSGAAWLAPAQLDALVRSSLFSLPTALYQDPLEALAAGIAYLDGQRRCIAVAGAAAAVQPSSASPSASVG